MPNQIRSRFFKGLSLSLIDALSMLLALLLMGLVISIMTLYSLLKFIYEWHVLLMNSVFYIHIML